MLREQFWLSGNLFSGAYVCFLISKCNKLPDHFLEFVSLISSSPFVGGCTSHYASSQQYTFIGWFPDKLEFIFLGAHSNLCVLLVYSSSVHLRVQIMPPLAVLGFVGVVLQ